MSRTPPPRPTPAAAIALMALIAAALAWGVSPTVRRRAAILFFGGDPWD